MWRSVEISHYVPYEYFITLPCILLLSMSSGFTGTPLTLLQLRYILGCFIVYFHIIFWDITCPFISGIQDFMHLLCTIIGHDISNNLITPLLFHAHCLYLFGRISGSNMFAHMFLTLFSLYFSCMGEHFPLNSIATPHLAKNNKNQNSYQSALLV